LTSDRVTPSFIAKKAERAKELQRKSEAKAARETAREAAREARYAAIADKKRLSNLRKANKQRIRDREAILRQATQQQHRLFYDDPRKTALVDAWDKAETGSMLAKLAQVGKLILQGTPASCYGPRKVYSLGNSASIQKLLSTADKPEIYVLRDPAWLRSREEQTLGQFLHTLGSKKHAGVEVAVQDLSRSEIDLAVCRMEVKTCISRFRESHGKASSRPVNLLNITCTAEVTPTPLNRHCRLLSEACTSLSIAGGALGIDKPKARSSRPMDIESCQKFQICGQAGAISSWHMDNLAPFTWVTLEGLEDGEDDENILKYWAVVDLQSLSDTDRKKALQDFSRDGQDWMPPPSWIRIISLVRGDTLIMPPGTIHAPIAVTDCFFRGGMCWSPRFFVKYTLENWEFISRNRDNVTNEDPAKQTKAVLAWIKSDLMLDPEKYGVQQADLPGIFSKMKTISDHSRTCCCKKNCATNPSCACHSNGHKCMEDCSCCCLSA